MTADLKAARARVVDMVDFLTEDPGAVALATSVAAEHAADLRTLLSHLTSEREENERLRGDRLKGQTEGFAAAVQWLRDRGAQHPPASLFHAALLLADQMEASRAALSSNTGDQSQR